MFSEEKLSQAEQKPKSIGKKSIYLRTSHRFEYKKAAYEKKKQNRKTYAYRML